MSTKARCWLTLPQGVANDVMRMQNKSPSQTRLLEVICWQISGAVAEFVFDESEYYGSLGLADIEDSYDLLSAYELSHNVPPGNVLAGCTVIIERLLRQHYEVADTMSAQLLKQGSLSEHEIRHYLSGVRKEALGKQVLTAFQEPWIEGEAERVHRMFVGS